MKLFYGHFFKSFYFMASLFTFNQNLFNYLLLASTWSFYDNFVSISLVNVFIGLFFLSNIIIVLAIFVGKKNEVLSKIKFIGISSNNNFLNIFYCFFGTGCILWTCAFSSPTLYYNIHFGDKQISEFKSQIRKVTFYNMAIVLAITVSTGILFYLENSQNYMKIIYFVNGLITSIVYVIILIKEYKVKDHEHVLSSSWNTPSYDFLRN